MVDSKKTEDDALKLLEKRAAKGGKWFEAICSALEEKYGESPMKYADSAAGESEDDPTWDGGGPKSQTKNLKGEDDDDDDRDL